MYLITSICLLNPLKIPFSYIPYVRGLDSYRTFCHFYFEEECSFSGLVEEEEGSGCLDLWMTKKAVGDKAPANN
jgi:hypothetical protein